MVTEIAVLTGNPRKYKWIFPAAFSLLLLLSFFPARAQFYHGMHQSFGKNRVQHDEFIWAYYKFDKFNIYFYGEGKKIATYTAMTADKAVNDLEQVFDYSLNDEKLYFIIYNKLEHFRQSNIGHDETDESNIGGVTRIAGTKVFIYFEGDHEKLEKQIRQGIAQIIIGQMMFGENWKEMLKNSALLNLPEWYTDGLTSYATDPWNVYIDDRVKDGVLTGKYDKFNRLAGLDARYAGHSLWNYIAEVYGKNVIPNIVYMARASRNVESGFLYTLNVSLKSLMEESIAYYKKKYEMDEAMRQASTVEPIFRKTKKKYNYTNLRISPDGRYAAFATHELGQQKLWLYDFQKKKKKRLKKWEHKLDRVNDVSYPLMAWHPSGDVLGLIREKKGEVQLQLYTVEDKKWEVQPIFKVEKVLDFSFNDNGREFVMSAMEKGQSDLYVYNVASKSQRKLTDDIYDDLQPRFIDNSNSIIFSSNRQSDTLAVEKKRFALEDQPSEKDIFIFDYATRDRVLRRITNTPDVNETNPDIFDKKNFSYLSNANGIVNRYVGYVDSTISFIDTVTHYRYFTNGFPVTNYDRNILEQDIDQRSGKYAEIIFKDGRYQLYVADIPENVQSVSTDMQNTEYRDMLLRPKNEPSIKGKADAVTPKTRDSRDISYTTVDVFGGQNQEEPAQKTEPTPTTAPDDSARIDINNYFFEEEKKAEPAVEKPTPAAPPTNSRFITLRSDTVFEEKLDKDFTLPEQRNYNIAFAARDVVTQFDFDFSNDLYQRFNGGPYVNPGMGSFVKFTILDLFEDYSMEGGFRYSFNNSSTEFFVGLENRIKRLDKKYIFQRQALTSINGFQVLKTYIHQGKYVLRYPFNEVTSVKTSFTVRNDRVVTGSTDPVSLDVPDEYITWVGGKVEYIFDNTLSKGLNLYNGSRYKLFAEYYQEAGTPETDIAIVGLDARNYQKIHRDLIWANRLAASTSFGNRKLVYYMGAVDNWIVASSRPRFDNDTEIATDQNYYFQTIATNMRGFIQNARNGNSFAVVNSELRFPVFKYFMNRPIKSDFVSNFQVIGFGDVGTAWTGRDPYSDNNSFNTVEKVSGPLRITLKNQTDPLIGAFGGGLRSKIWGYFVRFDLAWGVEDGIIQDRTTHFSLGLDF